MREINYPKAIVSYEQHRYRYAASLGRLNLKTSCQRIFQESFHIFVVNITVQVQLSFLLQKEVKETTQWR